MSPTGTSALAWTSVSYLFATFKRSLAPPQGRLSPLVNAIRRDDPLRA